MKNTNSVGKWEQKLVTVKAFKNPQYDVTQITDGKLMFEVHPNGHDSNGNPLYKIYPVNFIFRECKKVVKNMWSQNYYLEQTYSIWMSIVHISEYLYKRYPELNSIPEFAEDHLKDYKYSQVVKHNFFIETPKEEKSRPLNELKPELTDFAKYYSNWDILRRHLIENKGVPLVGNRCKNKVRINNKLYWFESVDGMTLFTRATDSTETRLYFDGEWV